MNVQLSTAIHRPSNSLWQNVSSKAISVLGSLGPVLPARLEEVRRGQEGIVTEDSGDGKQIRRAVSGDELVNLVSQIRQLRLDSRAKLIRGQQARLAVSPNHRGTVQQGGQWLEDLGQGSRGSGIGEKARRGSDGEGVQGVG